MPAYSLAGANATPTPPEAHELGKLYAQLCHIFDRISPPRAAADRLVPREGEQSDGNETPWVGEESSTIPPAAAPICAG